MSPQNMEDGIDAEWTIVDRVIAQQGKGDDKEYLVKWRGLEYSASTWEAADGLYEVEDQVLLASPESRTTSIALLAHTASCHWLSVGCCQPEHAGQHC